MFAKLSPIETQVWNRGTLWRNQYQMNESQSSSSASTRAKFDAEDASEMRRFPLPRLGRLNHHSERPGQYCTSYLILVDTNVRHSPVTAMSLWSMVEGEGGRMADGRKTTSRYLWVSHSDTQQHSNTHYTASYMKITNAWNKPITQMVAGKISSCYKYIQCRAR